MKKTILLPLVVAIASLASCSKNETIITIDSGLGCFSDSLITHQYKINSGVKISEAITDLPCYVADYYIEPSQTVNTDFPIFLPIYFIDKQNGEIVNLTDPVKPNMELEAIYFDSLNQFKIFCRDEIASYKSSALEAYPDPTVEAALDKCDATFLDLLDSYQYLFLAEEIRYLAHEFYFLAARKVSGNDDVIDGWLEDLATLSTAFSNITNHFAITIGAAFSAYFYHLYCYDNVTLFNAALLMVSPYFVVLNPNLYSYLSSYLLNISNNLLILSENDKKSDTRILDALKQLNKICFEGFIKADEGFNKIDKINNNACETVNSIVQYMLFNDGTKGIDELINNFKIMVDIILGNDYEG